MKTEILLFLIKCNFAVAVLYGACYMLLRKDTYFSVKRIVLLLCCVFAITLPFIPAPVFLSGSQGGIAAFNTVYLQEIIVRPFNNPSGSQTFSGVTILYGLMSGIYWVGVIVVLSKLLIQIFQILRILLRSRKSLIGAVPVRISQDIESPFSFWNRIFLPDKEWKANELEEILIHEQTHVRQVHSFDTLLSSLLCACCWFNPFAWFLRRELRMNLEYMADENVLNAGCDMQHYQLHLLRLSYTKAAVQISNNFNVSPLKKRIMMMNKGKKSRKNLLKYLLLLPLVAVLTLANITHAQVAHDGQTAVSDTIPKRKIIFEVVEQMPSFPGGDKALVTYLAENLQYPADAVARKTEGRVVTRFTVNEDGTISDIKILRSLSKSCDQEAIRVIEAMPKWIPGKQSGKNVAVYFALPIRFTLEKKAEEAK